MAQQIISIEGNVGSGKSTLVEALRKAYANDKRVCFLQEPVDEWQNICDSSGNTILEKYYSNQKKYAFSFQMMAYITRLSSLRDALTKGYNVIITERCVYTDKMVFARMLYDDDKIEDVEYQIYNKWFDEFIKDIPETSYVYVKTNPEVAKQRIMTRARKGEENIELKYLEKCHEYHETWLNNIASQTDHLTVIDGNYDTNTNPDQMTRWINIISENIKINIETKDDISYTLMFDGGSRGNPGPCGCGFVIYHGNKSIYEGSKYLGTNTNNYAEYMGLISGLEMANKMNIKTITIKGDSLLVIKQMRGEYNVNSDNLKHLHKRASDASSKLKTCHFVHVKRELNKVADALANKSMDMNKEIIETITDVMSDL